LWPLHSGITLLTGKSVFSLRASCANGAFGTGSPYWTYLALDSLWSLGTGYSLCALRPRGSGGTNWAFWTVIALKTLWATNTLESLLSLWPCGACNPLWAFDALIPLNPLWPLWTGRPGGSSRTDRPLLPLRTCGPCWTHRTGRSGLSGWSLRSGVSHWSRGSDGALETLFTPWTERTSWTLRTFWAYWSRRALWAFWASDTSDIHPRAGITVPNPDVVRVLRNPRIAGVAGGGEVTFTGHGAKDREPAAGCAVFTLWPYGAFRACWTRRTGRSDRPRLSLDTLGADRALGSCRACGADRTGYPGRTLWSGRPGGAFRACRALWPL
jgi:hypothetical protein